MNKLTYTAAVLILVSVCNSITAATVEIPHSFVSGTPAKANEVNENFNGLKQAVQTNSDRIDVLEGTTGVSAFTALQKLAAKLNRMDIIRTFPAPALDSLSCTSGTGATAQFNLAGNPIGNVVGLIGYEEISKIATYETLLQSTEQLTIDGMIGQAAQISISNAGTSRVISGIVTEIGVSAVSVNPDAATDNLLYVVKIEPDFSRLQHSNNYRVFQGSSVSDIVTQVFNENSINRQQMLSGSYDLVDFEMMYNESYANFVSRILEKEGILYFFNGDNIVLGDSPQAFQQTGLKLSFNGELVGADGNTVMTLFRRKAQQSPGNVAVTGYNFTNPSADLLHTITHPGAGEFYKHDDSVKTAAMSEQRAKILLDTITTNSLVFDGASNAPALAAGFVYEVTDNTAAALSGSYVVTKIHHILVPDTTDTCLTYANALSSIPSTVTFRPHDTATQPVIHGVTTAVVSGTTALAEPKVTDLYGRIKVQFHWNRQGQFDENSSAWIRVAIPPDRLKDTQFYVPDIGSEVVVSFINGDPSMPVVMGALYNHDYMPPDQLPDALLHHIRKYKYSAFISGVTGAGGELRIISGVVEGTISLTKAPGGAEVCNFEFDVNYTNQTTTLLPINTVVSAGNDIPTSDYCEFVKSSTERNVVYLTVPIFGMTSPVRFQFSNDGQTAVGSNSETFGSNHKLIYSHFLVKY